MVPHIEGLLRRRFALLKRLAEGDGWHEFLDRRRSFAPSTADPASQSLR
jgi:hypothetical protein